MNESRDADKTAPPPDLRCSFCNKSQRHVKKLVAGPNVQICGECIDICVDIITEDRKDEPGATTARNLSEQVPYPSTSLYLRMTSCSLCHMPTPLEHLLAIYSRGSLCPGCIGAIEAAVATAREEANGHAQ
jgi:hypothetical protein